MTAEPRHPDRVHGSVPAQERARYRRGGQPLLDLSANLSPYGAAPEVTRALQQVQLDCYPEPTCREAREAVAERFVVRPAQVAIGNGSAELIWSVARAVLSPQAVALEVRPTFGEFAAAVAACRARLRVLWTEEATGFRYDLAALSDGLRAAAARLCYLCTPNNPSGAPLPFPEIVALARRHPETVFLVDQAYLGLSPRADELMIRPPSNVVCLRSLTKEQGLPGVRAGYLIADEALVRALSAQRPSWTVNSFAQAMVPPAVAAAGHVDGVRERLIADRDRLAGLLSAAGLQPVPSEAPFVLAGGCDAPRLCDLLLERHGIAARDCTSFGLPRYIRLSGVRPADAPRLARALADEAPGRA